MFVEASPGSTGGGIKTTRAFTLFGSGYSVATNKHCTAFKRKFIGRLGPMTMFTLWASKEKPLIWS